MEAALWFVLSGTRGGANRARILRAVDQRPRNPNQLAEALDLNYDTVIRSCVSFYRYSGTEIVPDVRFIDG